MVSEIQVMNAESGYSFLIDSSTNTILAHKDSNYNACIISSSHEDEFLAEISTLTKTSSFQIYEVPQEKTLYFVALEPIKGTSWILASCVAEEEVFAELTKTSTIYIIIAIVAILISTIIISEIIALTVRPIRSLTQNISKISDGDFTVSITPKGNDEVSVMSYAMKKYVEDMRMVISEIRKISEQLQKNSTIGKESSVTLKDASYVQAKSMEGMKTTIEQLAYAVNEIANDATVLAQSVESANQNGEQANNAMQNTVTMAGQGL